MVIMLYTRGSIAEISTPAEAKTAVDYLRERYESVKRCENVSVPKGAIRGGERYNEHVGAISAGLELAIRSSTRNWSKDVMAVRVYSPRIPFLIDTRTVLFSMNSGLVPVVKKYVERNPPENIGDAEYRKTAVSALARRLDEVVGYISRGGFMQEGGDRRQGLAGYLQECLNELESGTMLTDREKAAIKEHVFGGQTLERVAKMPVFGGIKGSNVSRYQSRALRKVLFGTVVQSYLAEAAYSMLVDGAVEGGGDFVDAKSLAKFYEDFYKAANINYEAIERNRVSSDENEPVQLDLEERIGGLVGKNVVNPLTRVGIKSVEKVRAMSDEELLEIKNLGPTGVAELRVALGRI